MERKTLIFSAVCVVAGLTAGTSMAADQFDAAFKAIRSSSNANYYKGMSLRSFIRARFTGFYTLPERSSNMSSKNPRRQLLNEYYSQGKPLADGAYVNYAPYNNKNVRYIQKPKAELERFCSVNGGNLRPVAFFTKNIVEGDYINPIEAYLSAKTSLGSLKYKVSDRGDVMLSDQAVEHLARKEYLHAEKLNKMHDIQGSIQGYMSAIRDGAFGKFACISQQTNNKLWAVSILPITYKPANVDSASNEALYIGINPKG